MTVSERYLVHGDSLSVLQSYPAAYFDCIVTDPPYGLAFMAKKWDHDVPSVALWSECLRVLKPGGYLLAFGGTRTYHRLVVNIEDAGFEIRDMVAWLYGTGFPKSLDVSKAVDRELRKPRQKSGRGESVDRVALDMEGGTGKAKNGLTNDYIRTTPNTDSAAAWEGWGTALKPAHEPVVVARKPFRGTVAKNVLTYGTAGLNIDGCRISTEDSLNGGAYASQPSERPDGKQSWRYERGKAGEYQQPSGRWPANVLLDSGSAALLDAQGQGEVSRFFYCAKASKTEREAGLDHLPSKQQDTTRKKGNPGGDNPRNRGAKDRKNTHPTVKPIDLMRYLVRLVLPPGGRLLDPFAGSGTTIIAGVLEGAEVSVGIEKEAEYVRLAQARIDHWCPEDNDLFADWN